jgi:hypothetical protein
MRKQQHSPRCLGLLPRRSKPDWCRGQRRSLSHSRPYKRGSVPHASSAGPNSSATKCGTFGASHAGILQSRVSFAQRHFASGTVSKRLAVWSAARSASVPAFWSWLKRSASRCEWSNALFAARQNRQGRREAHLRRRALKSARQFTESRKAQNTNKAEQHRNEN